MTETTISGLSTTEVIILMTGFKNEGVTIKIIERNLPRIS